MLEQQFDGVGVPAVQRQVQRGVFVLNAVHVDLFLHQVADRRHVAALDGAEQPRVVAPRSAQLRHLVPHAVQPAIFCTTAGRTETVIAGPLVRGGRPTEGSRWFPRVTVQVQVTKSMKRTLRLTKFEDSTAV